VFLNQAQNAYLQFQRELTDLVQKYGSVIGDSAFPFL
jgi:hypothetical protein